MRRSFRLLMLVVLVLLLQCVPVMAADGDYNLTKEGEGYTLVYQTTDDVGKQVVLLMMSGSALTDGKVPISATSGITYIDQTEVAAGDGTNIVTFSSFIPMDTAEDYHSFYLGGLTGGPVWVATVSASGIMVSGTVEYFGSDTLTLNLYDSAKMNIVKSATVSKAAVDKTGPFAFSKIDPGTYYLKANKTYCVSEYKPVTILATDLTSASMTYKLYTGDVNNSGEINIFDISALLDDFGKVGEFLHQGSDVNISGEVNIFDISALLDGFGKANE